MNTIIKSFKGLAVMSAVSLALAGCSEDVMDRINQDTSHTNSVDGKFILADLITSTAFSTLAETSIPIHLPTWNMKWVSKTSYITRKFV